MQGKNTGADENIREFRHQLRPPWRLGLGFGGSGFGVAGWAKQVETALAGGPATPVMESTADVPTCAALIVASGGSRRMGFDKLAAPLGGQAVLARTLAALAGCRCVGEVVLVCPRVRWEAVGSTQPDGVDFRRVDGGAERQDSVAAGLAVVTADFVCVHDGARPLVSARLVGRVLDALEHSPGAAPALAVTDALWRGTAGLVRGTADRADLFRAQTPQGFRFDAILAAYRAHAGEAADDVEIARAAGLDVAIVEGEDDNIKLTWPADFDRAARLLRNRNKEALMDIRTGNGFDVHRFGPGTGCWLCGVLVPHERGLQGHSDADVGMHALSDAIYGALAMGDIGQHFPPSDPQWKGAASHIFLRHAADLARTQGFTLTHADVTLICERPKVGPHAHAMRAALADIMGLEVARVSVKATTSERLGFTGREEGIAALATATLVRP